MSTRKPPAATSEQDDAAPDSESGSSRAATRLLVFVYGTLLSGEPNHDLLAAARFLGPARSAPCFALVSLGAYPAMVRAGNVAVVGELYEVSADTLRVLDHLEGHPDLYQREDIRLADGRGALAYLLNRERGADRPQIPGGDWRNHQRARQKASSG